MGISDTISEYVEDAGKTLRNGVAAGLVGLVGLGMTADAQAQDPEPVCEGYLDGGIVKQQFAYYEDQRYNDYEEMNVLTVETEVLGGEITMTFYDVRYEVDLDEMHRQDLDAELVEIDGQGLIDVTPEQGYSRYDWDIRPAEYAMIDREKVQNLYDRFTHMVMQQQFYGQCSDDWDR